MVIILVLFLSCIFIVLLGFFSSRTDSAFPSKCCPILLYLIDFGMPKLHVIPLSVFFLVEFSVTFMFKTDRSKLNFHETWLINRNCLPWMFSSSRRITIAIIRAASPTDFHTYLD